ncbi:hypothetical protein ACFWFR_01010 [Oerskovia sp. NPDC060287]|uniref:hypothetical protein n=1 Tax=Oerskovia sp. NPDC060287 TaxID=3347095 RepID=UPI003651344D
MKIRTLFRRRRPAPLPVQALEALSSPALPRRVPALFFGAGSTATTEDEALVIASGALRQHGPREAVAVLEGFVSRELAAIPEREQVIQDPSLPYDDVEMEAFAPGSLADQAEAWLAGGAR